MFNLRRRSRWTAASRDGAPRAATLAPGFEIVPYPRTPLEQLYATQPRLRWFGSEHTRDLQLLIVVVVLTLAGFPLFSLWWPLDNTIVGAVLGAGVPVIGALIAGAYQIGIQRFSTVDIFSSEIAARMRTLAADNSVARIISGTSALPQTVAPD